MVSLLADQNHRFETASYRRETPSLERGESPEGEVEKVRDQTLDLLDQQKFAEATSCAWEDLLLKEYGCKTFDEALRNPRVWPHFLRGFSYHYQRSETKQHMLGNLLIGVLASERNAWYFLQQVGQIKQSMHDSDVLALAESLAKDRTRERGDNPLYQLRR